MFSRSLLRSGGGEGGFIWAFSRWSVIVIEKTCICVLLFATVCFQEAYSNCGGIYLSLVPVGQVIRLTQQERPPAHFCQRWKNKDLIPYYGKKKNYHQMELCFLLLLHLPYFSCFGCSLYEANLPWCFDLQITSQKRGNFTSWYFWVSMLMFNCYWYHIFFQLKQPKGPL